MATGRLGANDMSSATLTTVYTCPADTYAIASLNLVNRGNQALTMRIAVAAADTPTLGEYNGSSGQALIDPASGITTNESGTVTYDGTGVSVECTS